MKKLALVLVVLVALPLIAEDGPALYKAKCAGCHGATGAGDTSVGKSLKVAPLNGVDVQKKTDAEIEKVITGGKGKMPAIGKSFTPDQLKALVTVIRSFK
ncbi:MAG TPA: cytochrome c [Thermoanaerobaculia bacterium]|nr:cytochrome c [Thermoanaerobaculia bacterium]